MALTITAEQHAIVQSYAAAGNYQGGWNYLASIGDNYADNAYAVTSGNATGVIDQGFQILVQKHWTNTAGQNAYAEKSEQVARQHFRQYVDAIGGNAGYALPTSKQIEKSYRDAVEFANLPPETAFDGVFTRSIGDLADQFWPGPKEDGLDWTDFLRMEDKRQVGSDVFNDIDPAKAWDTLLKDMRGTVQELARRGWQDASRAWGQMFDDAADAFQKFASGVSGEINDIIEKVKKLFGDATTIPSPILLDLDGDGVETTAVGSGAYFDHGGDGFAEQTGWVSPDDGLLVRDLDGNGLIDTGRELFGSETLLADGRKAGNGFEALAELDANGDGKLDQNDPAFATLKVWKDADGNGRTDAGELLALEAAGAQSIDVGYTTGTAVDANGNAHKQVGRYTTTDGQARAATDVWVKTDPTYSMPTAWADVPADIALLPDAQGYGKVRDLHQAMAMDATGEIKALVTQFTQATTASEREALVTLILYRWTGVQDVDPQSRAARMVYGNAIGDARKLEALEEFMGEEWVGVWCWGTRDPNPHGRAAPVLLKAWDELKELVYGQLMAQSHLKALYQQIRYRWDEETAGVVGDLSAVAGTLAVEMQTDRESGLAKLNEFMRSLKGMGVTERLDMAGFRQALSPLGEEVGLVLEGVLAGSGGPTEGDDVLAGGDGDDWIDAKGGNDRLFGRGGNDALLGGAGSDRLSGGAGNDQLRGGTGNDTYVFGRGDRHDVIIEDSWQANEVDRIELKAGVMPPDVRLERVRSTNDWWAEDDLRLTIRDTGETLTVKRHFDASGRYAVEEIVFSDGTVWAVEDITARALLGESGDDDLRGFNGRNDMIIGGAGNDRLLGMSGNDALDGGTGDDALEGGTGSDTYRFGPGGGQDVIVDGYDPADVDALELAGGITPQDVTVRWTVQGGMAV